MHLNEDGTLGFGNPDAVTYASHGEWSVASIGGRQVRGRKPPTQPVNTFLEVMREDWDQHDASGRVEYIRGQLELIEHPLDMLDEFDHVTNADYTLGELYHARKVLTRLLPFMVEAAQRSDGDATS